MSKCAFCESVYEPPPKSEWPEAAPGVRLPRSTVEWHFICVVGDEPPVFMHALQACRDMLYLTTVSATQLAITRAEGREEGFDAAMRQAARTYWYEKGREVSDRFDQALARHRPNTTANTQRKDGRDG